MKLRINCQRGIYTNTGDIQVVETGREAIAVRTVDIIPATMKS